ncbi:hypothetical protein MMC13_005242 [Lambiella insularis]|nr:hypothetical protein [Lambiella insularis]
MARAVRDEWAASAFDEDVEMTDVDDEDDSDSDVGVLFEDPTDSEQESAYDEESDNEMDDPEESAQHSSDDACIALPHPPAPNQEYDPYNEEAYAPQRRQPTPALSTGRSADTSKEDSDDPGLNPRLTAAAKGKGVVVSSAPARVTQPPSPADKPPLPANVELDAATLAALRADGFWIPSRIVDIALSTSATLHGRERGPIMYTDGMVARTDFYTEDEVIQIYPVDAIREILEKNGKAVPKEIPVAEIRLEGEEDYLF